MSDNIPPSSADHRRPRPPVRSGLRQHSVAWFLGALVLFLVVSPFVQDLPDGRYLDAALLSLVLVAAAIAVGSSRRTMLMASLLAAPVIVVCWLQHHRSEGPAFKFYIVAFLLFLGFIILQFLRFIFRARRVDSEVLCAGASVYLLLGLGWAAAYALTARLIPGAFSGLPADMPRLQGFDALYFSLTTITTAGFGDLAPAARPARMLAMLEAVTGNLYLAVVISRLVSLYSSGEAGVADGK